jgi:bifunctional non-homologous end joining protein LigD
MADRLGRYRSKRDFEATPEPSGDAGPAPGELPRFVVQEHDATNLHWDLRLEHDGVALSWALPKGVPPDPRQNFLAVRTEDHPLEYLEFEGEIPRGQYGAGTMRIHDRGTYEPEKLRDDEVIVVLHGERFQGRYVLFRTDEKNWMIHRMDPPADPGREPPPRDLKPMLAKPGKLPRNDEEWAYEIKWDGVRALVLVERGRVQATSRNGLRIEHRYPELRAFARSQSDAELLLDGELVALDEEGRPNFGLLQSRMHVQSDSAIRRLAESVPVTFVVFDVLHLDGHSTMALPYSDRRKLLEQLELNGASWRTPASHVGDGRALLDASRAQGLEGIVAKKLDSPYEPGKRSSCWVKIRHFRSVSLLVCGWMPGKNGRDGQIGSLLMGYLDDDGELHYAGNVGTGFSNAELLRLQGLLEPLRLEESPFSGRQPPKGAVFAQPQLIAEVAFSEWTRTRTLRQPAYKGLRDDLDPAAIRFDEG